LEAGCASVPQSLASAEAPGTAIISYPNTVDRNWTTTISSKPGYTQAGVDGRVLTVTALNGRDQYANEFTLDLDGNLGIRGTLFSRSSRYEKRDIRPYEGDAIGTLERVRMMTYHYRNEAANRPLHIGFIAEDAPDELVGPQHDSFNINNSVALNLAATQELYSEVKALRLEVDQLHKELLKRSSSVGAR
jgi:hypothetical protein